MAEVGFASIYLSSLPATLPVSGSTAESIEKATIG